MSDCPVRTSEVPERERRLDEAVLAIEAARDRHDLDAIPAILARYADLRDELQALLNVEAGYLGFPPPPSAPVLAVPPDGYEVLGAIARGGWGEVVRARHRFLGREVAIKLLKAELVAHPSAVARFLEEAQIASQLQHPGIAPIHEVGRTIEGRPYFVMKLVDGRTLGDRLGQRRSAAEDLPRYLEIFLQVCRTLAYAHRTKGVLHRDLKPSNIMVGAFDEVQVMDWGLGKVVHVEEEALADGPAAPVSTLRSQNPGIATQHGARIGTPAYMPPEQANGQLERIGPHSDVFGLGAVLCEILTGQPPYVGTRQEVERQARVAALESAAMRLQASGAAADLVALTRRCLDADPGQRPADAGEVAAAVADYLNGLQQKVRNQELARVTLRWRLALSVALLVLLTGAAAAGLWYHLQRASRAALDAARAHEARERLTELHHALQQQRWDEARTLLARIEGRLAEGGPEELRVQVRAARRDVAFIDQRERIRQERAWLSDESGFDDDHAAGRYAHALREYGLNFQNPAEAAARIRAAPIRVELLAALDSWALLERHPDVQRPILRVAQAASATAWARQLRDPEVRASAAALARLAEQAPLDRLSAVEIESLALALRNGGGDDEGLLRRGQKLFPSDFWINLLLADCIDRYGRRLAGAGLRRARSEEAIGYVRAALALRPDSTHAQEFLGRLLAQCERFDEAESAFRRARGRSGQARVSHSLAHARLLRGDLEGAENVCREALRSAPHLAPLHALLGQVLQRQGRPGAARAAFAAALERQPRSTPAAAGLAAALLREGRCTEANAVCAAALRRRLPPGEDREALVRAQAHAVALLRLPRRDLTAASLSGRERALAAELCLARGEPRAALRLFEQAFASDAALAGGAAELFSPLSRRSLAARAAARIGTGPALRCKALAWLCQDLHDLHAARAARGAEAATAIRTICAVWLSHPDLAGLRGPEELPREERPAWRAFWDEVRALGRPAQPGT